VIAGWGQVGADGRGRFFFLSIREAKGLDWPDRERATNGLDRQVQLFTYMVDPSPAVLSLGDPVDVIILIAGLRHYFMKPRPVAVRRWQAPPFRRGRSIK
jgi:hypothetical protein